MNLNHDDDPSDVDDTLERAEHYRSLARELRAVAALVQNPDTRLQLRATADSYERVATSILAMRKFETTAQPAAQPPSHA